MAKPWSPYSDEFMALLGQYMAGGKDLTSVGYDIANERKRLEALGQQSPQDLANVDHYLFARWMGQQGLLPGLATGGLFAPAYYAAKKMGYKPWATPATMEQMRMGQMGAATGLGMGSEPTDYIYGGGGW